MRANPSENTGIALVAVDWGTSSFRLHLLSDDGGIVAAAKTDMGVTRMAVGAFEDYLLDQIVSLTGGLDHPKVLLCGMIGSTIGWLDAGYVACPASPIDVARKLVRAPSERLDANIVPGLSCLSPLGEPDVMRGEETQVLGWLAKASDQQVREPLLCLPGTHTKWIRISDGRVERFSTSVTGELFALLCEHSVLVGGGQEVDDEAFDDGVRLSLKSPALSQTLFSTRSRVLKGSLPATSARSFLSGLLIGTDVKSAVELSNPAYGVTVIGEPEISRLYCRALWHLSIEACSCDGTETAVHGLWEINTAWRRRP